MLKMVDGTGIIGVDMVCPLGGTVSPPQPPNYDRVELEGTGMLVLPNSLDAPLERLELGGKTEGKKQVIPVGEIEQGTVTAHAGNNYPSDYRVRTKSYINLTSGVYEVMCTGAKLGNVIFYSAENKYEKMLSETHIPLPIKFTLEENKTVRILFSNSESTPIAPTDIKNAILEADVSPEHPQEIVNSGKWNEETQKYEVDVKVVGKNLLNLRNPSVRFDRCILQEDGSIKSDIRSNYYFCSIYVDDPYVVDNIKNDQVITFSIGKGIQSRSITISLHGERVGSVNYQEKSSVPGGNSVSIVPSGFKKVSKIELRFNRSGSLFTDTETVVMDFMIHFGESTPYQPYKEQTLTITSDRPITKWDKLVEQDGQIGWLYGVRDMIFTGDESWIRHTETDTSIWFVYYNCLPGIKTHNVAQNIGAYSNYALWDRELANNRDGKFCTNGNPSNNFLLFGMPKDYTVETFKTWLREKNKSGKPMCLTYPTESTEFIPLPQEEQNAIRALKTYYPTTVITVDGGELDPDIKVTYRKEI